MRLQNLLIIFVVIALPVILTLSLYVGYQVDAANLQAQYDSKFLGATYDMLSAFQLNTTNNKYSTVSDSLIRDIEAAINTFSNSFGTGQGKTGTSKNDVMSHVPALVFTLYDGYYIYTPTKSPDTEVFEHGLKPYVYYTEEYINGNKKVVINYSLDNYVAVYYYNNGELYESKAGYLETGITNNSGNIFYNGKQIQQNERLEKNTYVDKLQNQITYSKSAYEYYKTANEFTKWYNGIIDNLKNEDKQKLKIDNTNQALPNVGSDFNDEKNRVIQNKITENLIQAMETYKKKTTIDFKMPKFSVYDWDIISNNICVISFIQGLVVGTTTYNNYVILPSTENKQYVNEKDIYYIGYTVSHDNNENKTYTSGGTYHRINCPYLLEKEKSSTGESNIIVGYNRTEFLRQVAIDSSGNKLKKNYYPHNEKACYYCVINAQDASLCGKDELKEIYGNSSNEWNAIDKTYDIRVQAYYQVLAREKYNLLKASEYINSSKKQTQVVVN